jgi:K+-transporting ATPase ATPase C chain
MTAMRATLRQTLAGLRLLLALTVLLGLLYPLAITGLARALPARADGSLVTDTAGTVVGSRLLAQAFDGDAWFHPRPSAGGYDPLASGGTNLGPENPDLLTQVESRRAEVARREGVEPAGVPADAVTASASGLDPDISPEYARLQVARVAADRGLAEDDVAALVEERVRGRTMGFIGAPAVNVLELNLALAAMDPAGG